MHRLYTVCLGCILGRSLAKPEAGHDCRAHALEARTLEQRKHLSLRESAANSAGPQFGIVDDRLCQLLRTHDIRDRNTPAWLEDTEHLLDHEALLEREIDDPV